MQVTKSLSTGRKQRESESKTTNFSFISISIKNKHIKNKVRNTVRVIKVLSVGEKTEVWNKSVFLFYPLNNRMKDRGKEAFAYNQQSLKIRNESMCG